MKEFDLTELINKRLGDSEGEVVTSENTANGETVAPETSKPSSSSSLSAEEGRVELPPPPFFGVREGKGPQYVLQEEKAHHRVILYALASGKTAKEISEEFGFTPAMVYYVEKQPWAKEFVANLIHQHGGDQVEKALKGAALDAANVLIEMKNDEEAPHAVRVNAAKEILDRIYGRSQQIINHRQVEASDLTDAELAQMVGNLKN